MRKNGQNERRVSGREQGELPQGPGSRRAGGRGRAPERERERFVGSGSSLPSFSCTTVDYRTLGQNGFSGQSLRGYAVTLDYYAVTLASGIWGGHYIVYVVPTGKNLNKEGAG